MKKLILVLFSIIAFFGLLMALMYILESNYYSDEEQEKIIITEEVCEENSIYKYIYNVTLERKAENDFGEIYYVFNSSYLKEIETTNPEHWYYRGREGVTWDGLGSINDRADLVSKEKTNKTETVCSSVAVDILNQNEVGGLVGVDGYGRTHFDKDFGKPIEEVSE